MLAVPRGVSRAEHKGLSCRRPEGLIVELGSVPDNFQHELRDLDGMRGRTVSGREKSRRSAARVRDVGFMVRGVEVLAVPAGRVENVGPPSAGTWLWRESFKVTTGVGAGRGIVAAKVGAGKAAEAGLSLVFRFASVDVANEHAEALDYISMCFLGGSL